MITVKAGALHNVHTSAPRPVSHQSVGDEAPGTIQISRANSLAWPRAALPQIENTGLEITLDRVCACSALKETYTTTPRRARSSVTQKLPHGEAETQLFAGRKTT